MASPLAATFFSSNADRNLAVPGNTVTFNFTSPPAAASNIVVSVVETVVFLDPAKARITDRPIGGFRGQIVNGTFVVQQILGAPLPPEPDPVTIRVATDLTPASPHVFAHTPDPEQLQSHTLRLRIQGTVKGQSEVFEGTALLNAEYPMAMIIAKPPPSPRDPSFAVVRSWALDQWKKHKPTFRHVEPVTAPSLARTILLSDYDELIAAFVTCAAKATSGVVALAVGHGDAGQTQPNGVPWCNVVPENFAPPINNAPFPYRLDIDDAVLGEGATPGSFPTTVDTITKLRAMDRLADALAGTGIRRILLHTCKAGGNRRFMQLFADRVRVPLLSHTAEVAYTGFVGSGKIFAHYASDTPIDPRDLRHWPISKVAGPFFPGPAPRRF